jgi:hypothetical protein
LDLADELLLVLGLLGFCGEHDSITKSGLRLLSRGKIEFRFSKKNRRIPLLALLGDDEYKTGNIDNGYVALFGRKEIAAQIIAKNVYVSEPRRAISFRSASANRRR